MRLYGAASAEGCQNGKDSEQDSQPLNTQTTFDGVHRAAGHRAILEADAVLDRQKRFCVLGGDTEYAGHPAPEHRAGAAECDCGREDVYKRQLSHYSNATTDIEFLFPFGWGELWGIADRSDFDLTQRQKASGCLLYTSRCV